MYVSPIASPKHHDAAFRWSVDVTSHIERATACRNPIGSAGLAFRIDPDGSVSDVRVAHSSGDALVDARAVAKLEGIGRVPRGPSDACPRTHFTLVAVGEPVTVPGDLEARIRRSAGKGKRGLVFA